MIAMHKTKVSLCNILYIRAYQFEETAFIFGCKSDNTFDSPSLLGSESEKDGLMFERREKGWCAQ